MPERLSIRLTLLLATVAFALAFGILALLGGGSSAAESAAASRGVVADVPGAAPDLRLASAASVPPLREPRRPRKRAVRRRKAPAPRVVRPVRQTPRPAPTPAPRPTAAVTPAPTSAPPRYVPPPSTPAPRPRPVAPRPTPAPTSPPPSGGFDTTGDGEFDSSGP